MKQWLIVGAVVVVIAVVAFIVMNRKQESEPQEATSAPAAVEPAAPAAAVNPQEAFLAENLQKPGWKVTDSGLEYNVLKSADPSAPKPAPGSPVTVNYEGTLIDGTVFDSSYARNEPATFPLSNVIRGWQEGVPMMRVGETWQFALPAKLAYGDRDVGPTIKGGSTLLFKIELLAAPVPATADNAMPAAAAPGEPPAAKGTP